MINDTADFAYFAQLFHTPRITEVSLDNYLNGTIDFGIRHLNDAQRQSCADFLENTLSSSASDEDLYTLWNYYERIGPASPAVARQFTELVLERLKDPNIPNY